MLLKEWCEVYGLTHTHPTTEKEAVSVVCPEQLADSKATWDLWHLEDYKVYSRAGIIVWLVPIKRAELNKLVPGATFRMEGKTAKCLMLHQNCTVLKRAGDKGAIFFLDTSTYEVVSAASWTKVIVE